MVDPHTSVTSRKLLQYYYDRNCDYYGNCNYWSGGRIAGVIIGIICFVAAVVFLIIALVLRRRRLARNQGPIGTYPVQQPYPTQTYPQPYPNQGYPPATGGYNPASAYPAQGVPAAAAYQGEGKTGYNGVQMQSLPAEQPYRTNV